MICDEPEQVVEHFQEALRDSARDLARTIGPDPQ